jgi:hypothetical protein
MSEGMISIGTQLIAPFGYLNLKPEIVFHFLNRSKSVRFVYFEEKHVDFNDDQSISKKSSIDVHLIDIASDLFDEGLDKGMIICKPKQDDLPPWLTYESNESEIRKRHRTKDAFHEKYLQDKFERYREVIDDMAKIVKMDNPFKYLNSFAKRSTPEINTKRLRLDFFSYILYSCNPLILSYQFQRIGIWPRDNHPGEKSGVKPLGIGAVYKHKSSDSQTVADIRTAWDLWGKRGESLVSIYNNTCAHIWNTEFNVDERGIRHMVRSDDGAILSPYAFRYRLYKEIGYEKVREVLNGYAFVREELKPSKGRFTETLSNVGERTEADGYWVEELVLGPDGKSPMPAIVVVRIVCVTSGKFLGIGFSIGGETSAAYRMALFCMSVKKSLFGRLFGMEIDDREWPSVGLCDDIVVDRGAGGGQKGRSSLPVGESIIRSMPPTGYGQGKATIESSHPRKIQMKDRPTHRVTSLSLIDILRREIQKTITANDSRDMSSRLTPKMLQEIDRPTPLGIFEYLSSRGRNSLRPISFADSVHSFLTKVTLTVKADGVYFRYQRYVSEELYKTGIINASIASGREYEIDAYMIDMSTKFCLLDWQNKLIEVGGVLALRDDEEQLFISVYQMEEAHKIIQRMKSDFRVHSNATKVYGLKEFERKTETSPEKISIRKGPPKRKDKNDKGQAKIVKDILTHQTPKS